MKNISKRIFGNQLRAAQLIAKGLPTVEIAKELDIDRATLWRWRKHPEFMAELSRLSDAIKKENKSRLILDVAQIQELVLETLVDVAQNSNQDSARVQAARTLKEYMDRSEERAKERNREVMQDQSEEIRAILGSIRQEKLSIHKSTEAN